MDKKKLQMRPLKGHDCFGKAFRAGKKFSGKDAMLTVVFRDENSESGVVFTGVTIRKKVARRAVMRNRIKRLLRESLRKIFLEYGEENFPFDTVIAVWNSAPKHPKKISLGDVYPVIRELSEQANTYFRKKFIQK